MNHCDAMIVQEFKIEHHEGLYFFKVRPGSPLLVFWDKWCGTRKVKCFYKKLVEVTYKRCAIVYLKFQVSNPPPFIAILLPIT